MSIQANQVPVIFDICASFVLADPGRLRCATRHIYLPQEVKGSRWRYWRQGAPRRRAQPRTAACSCHTLLHRNRELWLAVVALAQELHLARLSHLPVSIHRM